MECNYCQRVLSVRVKHIRCPCNTVKYCNKQCQTNGWRSGHKKTCSVPINQGTFRGKQSLSFVTPAIKPGETSWTRGGKTCSRGWRTNLPSWRDSNSSGHELKAIPGTLQTTDSSALKSSNGDERSSGGRGGETLSLGSGGGKFSSDVGLSRFSSQDESSRGQGGVTTSTGQDSVKSLLDMGPGLLNSSSVPRGVKPLSNQPGCSWVSSRKEKQPSSGLKSRGGLSLGKKRTVTGKVKDNEEVISRTNELSISPEMVNGVVIMDNQDYESEAVQVVEIDNPKQVIGPQDSEELSIAKKARNREINGKYARIEDPELGATEDELKVIQKRKDAARIVQNNRDFKTATRKLETIIERNSKAGVTWAFAIKCKKSEKFSKVKAHNWKSNNFDLAAADIEEEEVVTTAFPTKRICTNCKKDITGPSWGYLVCKGKGCRSLLTHFECIGFPDVTEELARKMRREYECTICYRIRERAEREEADFADDVTMADGTERAIQSQCVVRAEASGQNHAQRKNTSLHDLFDDIDFT